MKLNRPNSRFARSTFALFVGSNCVNGIVFVSHLIWGRLLSPDRYSDVTSFLSLVGLFSVVFSPIGPVVVNFVASHKATESAAFYTTLLRRAWIIGVLLFVLSIGLSPILDRFLRLEYGFTLLLAPILVVGLFVALQRSYIQGKLRFGLLTLGFICEAVVRIIVSVGLIALGVSSYSVLLAYLVGSVCVLVLTGLIQRDKQSKAAKRSIKFPTQVLAMSAAVLASVALVNYVDVLVVKHFFTSSDAGIYSSVATIGKIIYFAVGSISTALFAYASSRRFIRRARHTFVGLSIGAVLVIAAVVLACFAVIPKELILLTYGPAYLAGHSYILVYGVYALALSLNGLFVTYFLAQKARGIIVIVAACSIGQSLLIFVIHSAFQDIILVQLVCQMALCLVLGIAFCKTPLPIQKRIH